MLPKFGVKEMEHNGSNQNLAAASLCRAGCGFYGNAAFEGMCSKCYKDAVKRRQQNPTPTSQVGSGRMSPAAAATPSPAVDVSVASVDASAVSLNSMTMGTSTLSIASSTTPSVDTATPTVPSPTPAADKADTAEKAEGTLGGSESSTGSKDKEGNGEKKPKKNRCHTCKKKVGLTGFECRCGGLYCSLHRYSDKHECTFNYKEMAQEQIRKNNPVVVGEKIQKI